MTVVLFCQPLNDSSESLIDLLPLPAHIALQIKKDGGQEAMESGQNSTARSWALDLSVGDLLTRDLWHQVMGGKNREKIKRKYVLFGCTAKAVSFFS